MINIFDRAKAETNLQALYAISQIAAQAADLPTLYGPLLDEVLIALNVDAGSLMILEGDTLVRKATRGLGDITDEKIPRSEGGISWQAVLTRRPQVLTDLRKDKIASKFIQAEDFHSLVAVPMLVHDRIIGVMSIFTRKARAFSATDQNFFAIIANQAALAIISIQSAELLRSNEDRVKELEALNQISKSIATLFDFPGTLYSILVCITRMLGGDIGLVTLYDRKSHLLRGESPAFGLKPAQISAFRCRDDEGTMGQAFCQGVPRLAENIDAKTAAVLSRAKITGIKSLVAAPLKVKSQTLGVIQIFSVKPANFRTENLHLFSILATHAATIVNSSQMYRQIEEERKKDEALLSSIGDGVLAIDKNQKIIHLNPSGEKITGFLAEELLNNTLAETLGLYTKDKLPLRSEDSPLKKVLDKGEPVISEDLFMKKQSGAFFPAYLSLAAVRDVDDNITGAIVVFRDITYEEELEQMKQELISISTHELRAPITAIKGYLDMILAGDTGGVSGETATTLQEVAIINQRLADLVDDLLNVGRIEQGRLTVRLEPVDLGALIAQTVREYSPQADEKKIKLIFHDPRVPRVLGDSSRIRQVLNNLMSNALKYTLEGSIEIKLAKKEKEVVCEVADTGLGISMAAQKKLFQKFYRVRTAETLKVTGTGLGLWITRELLKKMNGKIWLESTEGKGSSFYFSLPLA